MTKPFPVGALGTPEQPKKHSLNFITQLKLILFPLALATGIAQGQVLTEGWAAVGRPDTYDGMLIGTVVGPVVSKAFPNGVSGFPYPLEFDVQSIKVEDSLRFTAGSVVEVYFPYRKGSGQESSLSVGERILLLGASTATKGELRMPLFNAGPDPDRHLAVADAKVPAIFGVCYFETSRTRLAAVSDPAWQMLTSVAEALRGTSDANAERGETFLENVRIPDWEPRYGIARPRTSFRSSSPKLWRRIAPITER